MAEHAGAGKRRRERRLRAHLRYARMSVAMVLAESNHHAAPRGQNMARDGVEGHEEKHNAPWRPSALTLGRKQSPSRTSRSPSRRNTLPSASWSRPSMHPVRELWKGSLILNMWRLRQPPPGGGGQANIWRPLLRLLMQRLLQ